MHRPRVIRYKYIHLHQKRGKLPQRSFRFIEVSAWNLAGNLFHQRPFIFRSCNQEFAVQFFSQFLPEFDERGGGPSLEGVFGAGMEGDPATESGRKGLFRTEEEGEGFGVGLGSDGFCNVEAADDFMLGAVGKGMCEQLVESFVNAGGSNEAGGAEERTEGKGEPLRGVKEEDGVEALFIEGSPKGEKAAEEGLFEEKEFVDVGVVLENLEADGAGEDGEIGVRIGFADIFNGGSGPEGVAEGGGRDDEDLLAAFVFWNEGAGEFKELFEEEVLHESIRKVEGLGTPGPKSFRRPTL